MKLPDAIGGVSKRNSAVAKSAYALTSFGAVHLAFHPCSKLKGIQAKANKISHNYLSGFYSLKVIQKLFSNWLELFKNWGFREDCFLVSTHSPWVIPEKEKERKPWTCLISETSLPRKKVCNCAGTMDWIFWPSGRKTIRTVIRLGRLMGALCCRTRWYRHW